MADIRINAIATTATDFASDDYIAIDGTANGTRKVNAKTANLTFGDVTLGTSGPSAKSSIAARAARQGLVGRATSELGTVSGVPGYGTNPYTWSVWLNTNSLSAAQDILDGAVNQSLLVELTTSGAILLFDRVANSTLYTSPAGTIAAGKTYHVTYSRGVGLFVNGVAVSTSITDNSNYTSGVTKVGSNNAGTVAFNGFISGPYLYNRALSAAEVVSLYEAGVPSGADYGVAAGVFNTNNSPAAYFDNGATGTFTSTSATGGTISYTGGANVTYRPAFVWYSNRAQQAGQYIKVTYTTQVTSGSPVLYDRGFMLNGGFSTLVSGTAPTAGSAFSGTQNWSYIVRIDSTGTNNNQLTFDGTANSKASWGLVVSNIAITPLGLLLAPDAAQAGGGLTWYDTSGNAANITLPASGVTWNVPTSGYVTSGGVLNLLAGGSNKDVVITPSGTGIVNFGPASASSYSTFWENASSANGLQAVRNGVTFSTPLTLQNRGGNVLLGTTTDSGNGKLQLASHTTSAGGIGFGTATGLYTQAAGNLALDHIGGNNPVLNFRENAVAKAYVGTSGSILYVGTNTANSVVLQTNATTALTLDSSQRTILSGALRLNNAYTASVVVPTGYVTIQDSTGTTYKVCVLL